MRTMVRVAKLSDGWWLVLECWSFDGKLLNIKYYEADTMDEIVAIANMLQVEISNNEDMGLNQYKLGA